MFFRKMTFVVMIALSMAFAQSALAAIELVTVTKATQSESKLMFRVDVEPSPNGSGTKQVTLVIPARQVELLHETPNTSYLFQIREGNQLPLNVPLALKLQRDGTLQTQITVSEENGKKAWVVLHVWLHPAGSGTMFSIDLGSYLTANTPAKEK
jgi:hypothetical protein